MARPQLDVLVVGGGFWGQAIAHRLRDRGCRTLVVDDDAAWGASRAAGGFVYPDTIGDTGFMQRYAPPWWTSRHTEASRSFLPLRPTGEDTFNNRDPVYRHRPGLHLVDPGELLATRPVVRTRILALERGAGCWRAHHDGGRYTARRLVVAAGVATAGLLQSAGVALPDIGKLPGRARLVQVQVAARVVPISYSTRLAGQTRTSKFFLRSWGSDHVRLGDTLEPDQLDEQLACLDRLLTREFPQGGQEAGWMKGVRPVTGRFFVELVGPGLVAATGGHRVGLAAAGGAALRVSELLE